jgi:uncharacterized membrane protein (DUF4010 family)
MKFWQHWLTQHARSLLILFILAALTYFAPAESIDPWDLLYPKKICLLIFTLGCIQFAGGLLIQKLGTRAGAIVVGFLGGLVSSTATIAAIAAKKTHTKTSALSSILTFLAANSAMLLEGVAVVIVGSDHHTAELLILFVIPFMTVILLIVRYSKTIQIHSTSTDQPAQSELKLLSLLKLTFWILVIITVSKLLQKTIGQTGLAVLTFLVSLFEVHGSFIANLQLYSEELLALFGLGGLLALSILASITSKLIIIFTIAKQPFKKQSLIASMVITGSLILSWLTFNLMIQ